MSQKQLDGVGLPIYEKRHFSALASPHFDAITENSGAQHGFSHAILNERWMP